MKAELAVFGGSGMYEIQGFEAIEEFYPNTPFGYPSDRIVICHYANTNVAFLPRHARGHVLLPHEIPVKANIYAMKMLGVKNILSFSAVGSLKEEIQPMDMVVLDQIIDRTQGRNNTFFGEGIVGHVQFSQPYCQTMRTKIINVLSHLEMKMHPSGTLVCIQGPAFSTKAESFLYRSWNCDVIGMTSIPEAKLAREAEICYAAIALVTDYDCWHEEEEEVSIEMVLNYMEKNVNHAKEVLKELVADLAGQEDCACQHAAQFAILTGKNQILSETRQTLDLLYGKYWK